MKHRTVAIVAVLLIIVFGATILVYPMLFSSVNDSAPTSIQEPVVPEPLNPNK